MLAVPLAQLAPAALAAPALRVALTLAAVLLMPAALRAAATPTQAISPTQAALRAVPTSPTLVMPTRRRTATRAIDVPHSDSLIL